MGKRYTRDEKKELCVNIIEGKTTANEVAAQLGASLATVKRWIEKYRNDPQGFKKKDIVGGIKDELQKSNGLIELVRNTVLPDGENMSRLGFDKYLSLHPDFDITKPSFNADEILKELLRLENDIYQEKSNELLKDIIPFYRATIMGTMEDSYPEMRAYVNAMEALYYDVQGGECSYDDYLKKMNELSAPIMHTISFSLMQSSKTRAGSAFEHSLKRMFELMNVKFEYQVKEGEGKTITDFAIPSMGQARINPQMGAAIECQTTLKDRFRLTLGKSASSQIRCYLATPTGVGIFNKRDSHDISLEKLQNIVVDQGVALVVFPDMIDKIRTKLETNIESDNPELSKDKAKDLLEKIGTKIITYSEFFENDISSMMDYWNKKR